MKLSEYLEKCEDGLEVTVWDKEYDTEVYFYAQVDDDWDKAVRKFASALEVVEIRERGIVVNMGDVIESRLEKINDAALFNYDQDADDIMEQIDTILAGNVSEKWMKKFADVLVGE